MMSPAAVRDNSSSLAVSDSESMVLDPSDSSSAGSAGGTGGGAGARSKYSAMLGSPEYARMKHMQTWSFHLSE
jgi:hypothetical protein